jgi:xanthine/uracil permease
MKFNYFINDVPPLNVIILNGLQWFILLIPIIIIVGKTIGISFSLDPTEEVLYIQKLSFVVSLSLLLQVFFGHSLPIVSGPPTVLLVGIIASLSYSKSSIYTALLIGSFFVCIFGLLDITKKIVTLFTRNIISVVLILIAFTMLPTILKLILSPIGLQPVFNIVIALLLIIILFFFEKNLKGFWKSSLIIWLLLIGTIIYCLIFGSTNEYNSVNSTAFFSNYFTDFSPTINIDVGLILTFLICYIALIINDVGSMQSTAHFVGIDSDWKRIKRGIFVTGFSNIIASIMGTIGVVNFSFSPGVLLITKCASKFVLLFTALLLFILSFSPYLLGFISVIPHFLIGTIFFYVMASQISAGLSMLYSHGEFKYNDGIIVGFSIMLGTMITNLPGHVMSNFPGFLKPFLGNGFVMGILAAFILEHLIYKKNN